MLDKKTKWPRQGYYHAGRTRNGKLVELDYRSLLPLGGLAAALSTASGLLLVISSSIANDLYYRTLNPKASQKNQLLVGRVTIAVAVVIAGYFGFKSARLCRSSCSLCFRTSLGKFFPCNPIRYLQSKGWNDSCNLRYAFRNQLNGLLYYPLCIFKWRSLDIRHGLKMELHLKPLV